MTAPCNAESRCRDSYQRLLPFLYFTGSAIDPAAVGSLMKVVGLPAGSLRRALTGLEDADLAHGIHIVQQLDLDRACGGAVGRASALAA